MSKLEEQPKNYISNGAIEKDSLENSFNKKWQFFSQMKTKHIDDKMGTNTEQMEFDNDPQSKYH